MITAMAVLIVLLVLVIGFTALTEYARHDRFAGPSRRRVDVDDLGAVPDRNLVRF
jgi:ABC-type transporter Mla subunit MlaD